MKEKIIDFLRTDAVGDISDCKSMKETTLKYPYFQGLLFYYLKSLYLQNESEFQPELRRLAPFISDRKALFYSIFSEEYAHFFEQTGKTELSEDRTALLLNAFFNQIGETSESEQDNLDENILNAGIVSNDYFSYLEQTRTSDKKDEEEKKDEVKSTTLHHQDIIDNFIKKSDEGEDFKVKIKPEEIQDSTEEPKPFIDDDNLDDSMFFTETLAQIYIKQKKYEKAYKIITQLNLNYPKKNSYFADQIRFLEKLMQNSAKKRTE